MAKKSKSKKKMDLIDSLVFRDSENNRDNVSKNTNSAKVKSSTTSVSARSMDVDTVNDRKIGYTILKIAFGFIVLAISIPLLQAVAHMVVQLLSIPIVILAVLVIMVLCLMKS
ncbi:hypothetical protein MTBBW1_510004 [Desulfamplus magnetovallimortis]|uniref:Uncharacterized protein n=1 Tax=Desulfamplus magnetovallimortis TaxID=1246637 RepID=A0A1W1HHJ8_9BACT|nr:hypothetical protein [Desulfamplus magnetovallimortis]SLM31949.1 hypothetical protein MTBBW1_510004 [Desulfamplus magnetovallimortis]